VTGLTLLPVTGVPEVGTDDDLAALLLAGLRTSGVELADGDVLVVSSKVVSKSLGLWADGADHSAAVAAQTTTAADGSFAVAVQALGTVDAPATVSIKTPADTLVEVIGDSCSQTWSVAIDADQDLTLSGAAPDPVTLTATTTLMGEVCGTTGVPPTSHGGGSANITPPPTDTFATPTAGAPDQLGPALTIGFVVGLLAVAALLLPRPRARRRD